MSESDTQKPQHQVAELKVSGHTMALDPGLYCVFSAPNSVLPAADTGLPTVRVSAAPGPASGRVEVVGLHEGGWIGPDSAALIRVADARSIVLVTVYQARDARADAPQIQVVRISAEPGAAAIAPPPAVAAPQPANLPAPGKPREVHIVAHIYGRGDVGGEFGEWVGEPGSKRWIEGFAVAPVGDIPAGDVEYQAVLGRGWLSPWSEGGQFCGSRSMALPILGLRVRLRGASAATHHVVLSATFIDGTKVGPVADGEPCEAASLAALESFHLALEPTATEAKPDPKPDPKPAAAARVPKPAAKEAAAPPRPAKRGAKPLPAPEPPVLAKTRAANPTRPAPEPAKTPPAPKSRATPKPAPTRRR